MSVKRRRKAEAKGVCDTPNDQAERVMVGKMNASFMQFNMAQVAMQNVHNRGQNEWHACAMKKKKMGMTPTPPWAGKEAARRRAHGLLDRKSNGETKAVGVALNFEPSPRRHKVKVKLYENTH
jgi:hypothetical protein